MKKEWDLTLIYPTLDEFESDLKDLEERIGPELGKLEGKLKEEESFKRNLDLQLELEEKLSKVYRYASMASDLNKKDIEASQRYMRVRIAFSKIISNISYIDPEVLSLGKEYVDAFLKKHPEYSQFDFSFEKLFRGAAYTLEAKQERLLSNYGQLSSVGANLYSQLTIADYKPAKIKLSDGKEVEVNQSSWTHLVESAEKPEDRKAIFEALYKHYDEHKNTYGEIYRSVVEAELATKKSRGYDSILQSHLFHNNIPESVFLNLIDVASKENEALHRYYEIKRKYLGLDKFRSYDRFVQLAKSGKKYSYEEARELFFESIKHFPKDFQDKAREVSKEGYVDVFPKDGKRSGAYSNGGENGHPYILLNFMGGLDDVFTLAHESGHSIHTLYAMESQPLLKQGYTIFVAEIASTFNEHNLLDYLLRSGTLDKEDKIFLLQKSIDEICSTFYRQSLFAHFEYDIAKIVEEEKPINYQVLSDEMTKLYKQYYGIDITEEVYKPLVWAYIPHMYNSPFYVYQYATSFTASMLIYQNVKEGKPHAFDNYIKMLQSGGSTYPIDEVKLAGVDLTDRNAFLAVTNRMKTLVDELEKLLEE